MAHISSFVSSENPSSTAPARVPAAMRGLATLEDHANVAVLGISRKRSMLSNGSGAAHKGFRGLRGREGV